MAHQPAEAVITGAAATGEQCGCGETLELAATAYEDSIKDTPQAVATLRQAILLDPKNINLYVDFANISSAHDSFQVGIDVVTDGIGQIPSAAPLYLARASFTSSCLSTTRPSPILKAQELDPGSL